MTAAGKKPKAEVIDLTNSDDSSSDVVRSADIKRDPFSGEDHGKPISDVPDTVDGGQFASSPPNTIARMDVDAGLSFNGSSSPDPPDLAGEDVQNLPGIASMALMMVPKAPEIAPAVTDPGSGDKKALVPYSLSDSSELSLTSPKTMVAQDNAPDVADPDVGDKKVVTGYNLSDSSELPVTPPNKMIAQDNAPTDSDATISVSPESVAGRTEISSLAVANGDIPQQLKPATKHANGVKIPSQTSKSIGKTSRNMVDLDSSEDKVLHVSDHLPLNRHIYKIFGPGVATGKKLERAPHYLESSNCPYHAWPLYNNFKPITKGDRNSWPPAFVNLQDWHVFKILQAGIPTKDCNTRWPADFLGTGRVSEHRNPKGRAAKMDMNGVLYYVVLSNNYQLSGDEGSQAVTLIPPIEGTAEKRKRDAFTMGQDCEVQNDFVPSTAELKDGTLISRLPKGALGPRPLNNRSNWGPEDRTGDIRPKKANKKNTNIPQTTTNIAETQTFSNSQSSAATIPQKRSRAESSTEATRKVAKTANSATPSAKSATKTGSVSEASGSNNDKNHLATIEPTESTGYIIVKAGLFNKTPRTREGPVLESSKLQHTQRYFGEMLDEAMKDINKACTGDNHDLSVSKLLCVQNILKDLKNASDTHFEQACKEVIEMEGSERASGSEKVLMAGDE